MRSNFAFTTSWHDLVKTMKSLQYLALGSAMSLCALAFQEATTSHKTTASKTSSSTINATTFRPKTCVTTLPKANPTATVTLTSGFSSPVVVGMYTPLAGGKPSVQLAANGTRFLYSVVTSKNGKSTQKGIHVISGEFESLLINPDGTYEYIAPNCASGISGTIKFPSPTKTTKTTTKKTTTGSKSTVAALEHRDLDHVAALLAARVAPPGDGEPKVEVDLTLVNQCAALLPGQSPHLLCLQTIPNGANPIQYSNPVSDFQDKGNGLYVGVCEITVDIHNLCIAGEAACSSLGQFLIDKGIGAACGAIGLLSGNPFVVGGAAWLCDYLAEQGLSKLCSAEGLDGDFSKCQPAAVTPVVSMQYLSNGDQYTTAATLSAVTGQFSTTVSPTLTALVPSCTVPGNPFPQGQAANCPYEQLSSEYASCNNCYESGLPWEAGISYGLSCNTCCGCCFRGGSSVGELGPQSVCCSQDNYKTNPNCYADYCSAEFASGRYQEDCNVPTVEDICTNSGYDYGHPFLECPSPDFASLFNPNATYIFNQSLCSMGYPPPPGFVDQGSVSS